MKLFLIHFHFELHILHNLILGHKITDIMQEILPHYEPNLTCFPQTAFTCRSFKNTHKLITSTTHTCLLSLSNAGSSFNELSGIQSFCKQRPWTFVFCHLCYCLCTKGFQIQQRRPERLILTALERPHTDLLHWIFLKMFKIQLFYSVGSWMATNRFVALDISENVQIMHS